MSEDPFTGEELYIEDLDPDPRFKCKCGVPYRVQYNSTQEELYFHCVGLVCGSFWMSKDDFHKALWEKDDYDYVISKANKLK